MKIAKGSIILCLVWSNQQSSNAWRRFLPHLAIRYELFLLPRARLWKMVLSTEYSRGESLRGATFSLHSPRVAGLQQCSSGLSDTLCLLHGTQVRDLPAQRAPQHSLRQQATSRGASAQKMQWARWDKLRLHFFELARDHVGAITSRVSSPFSPVGVGRHSCGQYQKPRTHRQHYRTRPSHSLPEGKFWAKEMPRQNF